jgi:hypothetical protein
MTEQSKEERVELLSATVIQACEAVADVARSGDQEFAFAVVSAIMAKTNRDADDVCELMSYMVNLIFEEGESIPGTDLVKPKE